jgi:hypothetical protein
MFYAIILKRILITKKEELGVQWIKLHDEELQNLSSNDEGETSGTWNTRDEMRNSCKLFRKPEERGLNFFRELVVLIWILKKRGVRLWTGFIWLRTGTNGGLL